MNGGLRVTAWNVSGEDEATSEAETATEQMNTAMRNFIAISPVEDRKGSISPATVVMPLASRIAKSLGKQATFVT
ncbi:MAG: hypothetical protein ABI988_14745 [Nitrospirota bacterium]